jgi:regulator of sirC expression with transglutaminase-like and TPR domain
MSFDPQEYLKIVSTLADDEIDLAPAALALAAVSQPVISLERYFNHLKKLAEETASRHQELLKGGAADTGDTQLAALKHIIADKYGYQGDHDTYDDLQNASLTRVIDRGKGMPIALAILYIHAGKAQGWDVEGLDMPGHFLCRLQKDAQRIIFDPFENCKKMEAPDLRALVKRALGPAAELSAHYYEPASARGILIRLQNNLKYRLIASEDYAEALKIVETMRMIAPSEYRLLLDAGVLYARTNQPMAAIHALEDYIEKAPQGRDRHDAVLLLRHITESLH